MSPLYSNLLAVKALIDTPATWCVHFNALTQNGIPTDPTSADACQWCLTGAMVNVASNATPDGLFVSQLYGALEVYLFNIAHKINLKPFFYLSSLNDREGFNAVHQLLDAAIADAKLHEPSGFDFIHRLLNDAIAVAKPL